MSKNLEALVWEAEQKWVSAFDDESIPDFLYLCDLISEIREEGEEEVVRVVIEIVVGEANAYGEEYSAEKLAQIEEWVVARTAEVI